MLKFLKLTFKTDEDYERAIGILSYENCIEYNSVNKSITVNEQEMKSLYIDDIPFLKFVNDEEIFN